MKSGNQVFASLCLLASANAFSPFVGLASKQRLHPRTISSRVVDGGHEGYPVAEDGQVVDTNDIGEPIGISDSILNVDPFVENQFMNEQVPKTDQGKEIFLASIASTTPEEMACDLGDVDACNNVTASSSLSMDDETYEFEVSEMKSSEEESESDTALTDDERTSVISVLAASQQAAKAAEAAMPLELVEQLELSSSPSNGTVSNAPISIDKISEIKPASEVVGEPVTAPPMESPGVAKILKFAIPAIGVWLCGPLLSLIDTSAVGLLSGTTQQAALNPAVAVTDYAALLIAFMYTGTTNLVAAAQESDRGVAGKPTTTKTMIGAMQLSTYVGGVLGAVLFVFARPLLNAIVGTGSVSPAVFEAAMKYVRIRALGMPAAAIIGSAQAACLGMQDIRSPLYVLLAAAIVNFFGDMFFVGSPHRLIGGAAGAAWATVFSQYAAVALFMKWLTTKSKSNSKPPVMNLSKAIMEMTGKPTSEGESRRQGFQESLSSFALRTKKRMNPVGTTLSKMPWRRRKSKTVTSSKKDDSVSVRGFLKDRFTASDLLKFPSKEMRRDFSPFVVPVTTTQVGRVSGYVAMSHVIASSMGTVSMAAQQVVVSLFYCLCPIADSLSLTAQSFIPSISERKPSRERAEVLGKSIRNFFKAGAVFGASMMATVCAIPLLSGFFTSDPAVVALVNAVVPLLLAFFSVHGLLCSAEGLLLGQKDLSFLGKMYAVAFFAVPALLLRLKRAALSGTRSVDLTSVWKVFVGYQLIRLVAWVSRVYILQRKTQADAADAEESYTLISP